MDPEIIYEYATTEDEERAAILFTEIYNVFLFMYDQEFQAFAEQNNIDVESKSYQDIREEYAAELTQTLLNLRVRTENEREKLLNLPPAEVGSKLQHFVVVAWRTISDTETGNARQSAQLQASLNLLDADNTVTIKKRWMAHPDCCPICAALNGTEIDIDEYFLVGGQVVELADGSEFVYEYKDRAICIAHPNDRCWIEFIVYR